MNNTKHPSVLSLLGTYRFKATAVLIFSHPSRDGLFHGTTAKGMQEGIVHMKVSANSADSC